MKWDKDIFSGRKLPLRFLFLCGFLAGILAVYLGKGTVIRNSSLLNEDVLYRMKYITVDSSALFGYIICKRCRNFLILIVMATTYLGLIFCGGVTAKYGFSVGLFLGTTIYLYGIKGILLGIVGIFPHYFLYVPAMIMLLRWCEEIHRSIYFYHNITGQGKKSLPGKLIKLLLILVILIFGCVLESFVNPVLLKGFLQFF